MATRSKNRIEFCSIGGNRESARQTNAVAYLECVCKMHRACG
jgi:hypothetical protein